MERHKLLKKESGSAGELLQCEFYQAQGALTKYVFNNKKIGINICIVNVYVGIS